MKQRAVALMADYLSYRAVGRIVGLKPIGDDDYVVAIEDVRDERVHVGRTPRDFEPWLRSIKEGRYVLPTFGLWALWRPPPRSRPRARDLAHMYPVPSRPRRACCRAPS